MVTRVIAFGNPRLAFRDAGSAVREFVRERLARGGFDSPVFAEDRTEARSVARALAGPGGALVLVDLMNPILDLDLIRAMLARLERSGLHLVVPDGAIPGTQPEVVLRASAAADFTWEQLDRSSGAVAVQRWGTQAAYNNQFNLYKYKRLKVFLGLCGLLPELPGDSIPQLCRKLEEDEVFFRVIGYFEDCALTSYDRCPHCRGRIEGLRPSMSQPFIGYLPASRPYYHECEDCGLIVLSPQPAAAHLHRVYDAFDMQDFVASANNPYTGGTPRCDLSPVRAFLPAVVTCLDLGGGVGRFSMFLKSRFPNWTVTHSDFAFKRSLELEARGVKTRALDCLSERIGEESYDLITAWEMIEHMPFERLADVLDNIHRALRPGGIFRFSTPDFDSPLCQAFDFFNACPPFHTVVFRRRWLERYFGQDPRWTIVETRASSDFLDDAVMWFDYAAKTSPSFQLRGLAAVLQEVFRSGHGRPLTEHLLASSLGTEMIMSLRKQV